MEFAEADAKRYRAALRLGLTTDTQDIWGQVLEEEYLAEGTRVVCLLDAAAYQRVVNML